MSHSSAQHPRTSTCVFSAAHVTPTLPPLRHTSLPLGLPDVSSFGYSSDHKGYCCLDLSTNRIIVSRHVVFDEASFPHAASPNLTNLEFLVESGSPVSTIGTPLPLAGTSPTPACLPTPVVPPGFAP